MGRNTLAVSIIILILAVIVAAGYLYYQKNTPEEIPPGENLAKTEESANNAIPGTSKLPVTDDPGGIGIPVDPGQVPVKPDRGSAKDNPSNSKAEKPPSAVSMDIGAWSSYKNKKYGYSFKYPAEFDFRDCTNENPCKFGQVLEKDGGDLAYLSAQNNQRGWPYITVAHYNNENFTLPKGQKLIDWFKGKFQGESAPKDYNYEIKVSKGNPKKATRISFPQTPQGYAKEEIYFADGSNIFQIQLLDTNKSEAWSFYNPWLENFIWQ